MRAVGAHHSQHGINRAVVNDAIPGNIMEAQRGNHVERPSQNRPAYADYVSHAQDCGREIAASQLDFLRHLNKGK